MKYNKTYKVDGEEYRAWSQKDSYGNKKYGWNRFRLNNWYDDTQGGYDTAKDRDEAFKQLRKENA